MESISPTTFWGATVIVASSIGASFLLSISHSSEPKHSEAAYEIDVTNLKVSVERIETNQIHAIRGLEVNSQKLEELRREQETGREEILEAIRTGSRDN